MNRSLTLALMTFSSIVVACSSAPPDQLGTGGAGSGATSGNSGSTTTSGAGAGTTSSASGNPSGTTLGPSVDKSETLSGDIDLPATATIAQGVTLTLKAGATIHAAAGASLVVKGKLIADGTAGGEVVFQSKAHAGPGGWGGIVVQSGGDAKLTHIAVHDATLAFQADAGSTYAVDYILVDTSSSIAELDSSGTLGHGQLHALGANQAMDAIFVSSASPQISDTLLDNSNPGTDQINVSGATSAPSFDHVEISGCHCAFHFNQGKGIVISNSYVHDAAYGMMVLGAVNTQVSGNNFENNQVNIGDCNGGGSVIATGNYFATAAFDMSCSGQTNSSPSGSKLASVGPRP